jgi:hypothetical protein
VSFQSKFSDGIYKGTYPEEKVSTWKDIGGGTGPSWIARER